MNSLCVLPLLDGFIFLKTNKKIKCHYLLNTFEFNVEGFTSALCKYSMAHYRADMVHN